MDPATIFAITWLLLTILLLILWLRACNARNRAEKRIAKAEASSEALKDEIEALTHQKRGVVQKLLTGEWRVPLAPDETTAIVEEAGHAG